MKPINHILCHLLPTLIVLALTSCSHSDSPAPTMDEVQLSLMLSVGEVSGDGTRAPSDGEYNEGDAAENYIDIFKPGNVRVVLFKPDNTYLGELTDFVIAPVYTGNVSKRYILTAGTKLDIKSGKFKVMVLANWPDYPEGDLTLDKVWKQEFHNYPALPSEENPIPLFGIKELSITEPMEYDIPVNLGVIHLLRAVAKIEVVIKGNSGQESDNVWQFEKLQLTNYNNRGLCAPDKVDGQEDYVKDSWANDYVSHLSIPANPDPATALDFSPMGDNHYVVYIPEYNNQGAGNARIIAKIADSLFPEKEIVIVDPATGKPLDFHRNVWYRITINKNLEAQVDVIPYAARVLNPIFGVDIYEKDPEDNEDDSLSDPIDPNDPDDGKWPDEREPKE